jgi:hypothetical protein
MAITYDILVQLSEGTLEMKESPIFGPTEMESVDQCLLCMDDPLKWVCSVDGVAWCCEQGDIHPNCYCYGNAVEDFMYCKSDPAKCGPTTIKFDSNNPENITIVAPTYNTLCTYKIEGDVDGVVDVNASSWVTVVDPDDMTVECLATPCNTTVSLYNDNEVYVVNQYGTTHFEARFIPGAGGALSKGI